MCGLIACAKVVVDQEPAPENLDGEPWEEEVAEKASEACEGTDEAEPLQDLGGEAVAEKAPGAFEDTDGAEPIQDLGGAAVAKKASAAQLRRMEGKLPSAESVENVAMQNPVTGPHSKAPAHLSDPAEADTLVMIPDESQEPSYVAMYWCKQSSDSHVCGCVHVVSRMRALLWRRQRMIRVLRLVDYIYIYIYTRTHTCL